MAKSYKITITSLDYAWDSFARLAVDFSHLTSYSQQHLHQWLHPSIIFPLCCIMGFRAAQWFLRLARYELVHQSTHTQIHSDTVTYSTTLSHNLSRIFFLSVPFVQYLMWTPTHSSSSVTQAKVHPLVKPCIIQQQALSHLIINSSPRDAAFFYTCS